MNKLKKFLVVLGSTSLVSMISYAMCEMGGRGSCPLPGGAGGAPFQAVPQNERDKDKIVNHSNTNEEEKDPQKCAMGQMLKIPGQ